MNLNSKTLHLPNMLFGLSIQLQRIYHMKRLYLILPLKPLTKGILKLYYKKTEQVLRLRVNQILHGFKKVCNV